MCSECGVSTVTMCRALSIIKDEGLVRATPKGGVRLLLETEYAPKSASSQANGPAHRRWEQVRHQIARDLVSGLFPPGSQLPSYKELSRRYRACFTTIRQALHSLVDDGRLVPDRRKFRVHRPAALATRATLAIVARGPKGSWTPRSAEFWRVLEKEALRLNVQLEHCIYDGWSGMKEVESTRHGTLRELERRQPVLGFMVWTISLAPEHVENLLRLLARRERPVAVVDETGAYEIRPAVRRFGPSVRFFPMANSETAGRIVGHHLLSLGHRKIGYVIDDSSIDWSRKRGAGLREAFADAGVDAVREYCLEDYEGYVRTRQEVLDSLEVRRLWDQLASIEHDLVRVRKRSNEPPYTRHLRALLSRATLQAHLEPVFDRMLSNGSITAWVAGNDAIALHALDYLERHNIRLPNKLSLIGFDDTPEALAADLSSYNFNVPAVAQSMLQHILDCDKTLRRRAAGPPAEIPGIVVERTTSGPAPVEREGAGR